MSRRPLLAASLLSTLTLGACGSTPVDESLVTTEYGPVRGALTDTTRRFLGIPYAAPPVGERRWKPPAPPATWSAPLDALDFQSGCMQTPSLLSLVPRTDEDCLYLNVFTPRPAPAPATPAPVMVFIHGGGFDHGAGSESRYDGQSLAEAGVVLVTLNYRLGALGFLAHPALSAESPDGISGNQGILDQRAALQWVRRNIAAFGGDPKNVTVFGESAGAVSIYGHLLSPKSAGLFDRAILESGVAWLEGLPLRGANPTDGAEGQGLRLAKALGCDGANPLACLREKSETKLLTALKTRPDELFGPGDVWAPTIDGVNLTGQPGAQLLAGNFAKVPVMVGSNGDEGSVFLDAMPKDATEYEAALAIAFGDDRAKAVAAAYPSGNYASFTAALSAAIGDGYFVCDARRAARAFAKAGQSVYRYSFTRVPSAAPPALGIGSFHSAEIQFIFGGEFLGKALAPEEKPLESTMRGYWTRFARAGDPNGGGATAWPRYDASTDPYIRLDLQTSTGMALKKDLCDFWDAQVR